MGGGDGRDGRWEGNGRGWEGREGREHVVGRRREFTQQPAGDAHLCPVRCPLHPGARAPPLPSHALPALPAAELFEHSARSQTALLAVVLLAACMIISDGAARAGQGRAVAAWRVLSAWGHPHCCCRLHHNGFASDTPKPSQAKPSQANQLNQTLRTWLSHRAGVLTPAISVVSAIEGIQFQTGISTGAVVGISIAILVSRLQMLMCVHDGRGLACCSCSRCISDWLPRLPTPAEPPNCT